MPNCNFIIVLLSALLCGSSLLCAGCGSKTDRKPEPAREAETKTDDAPDGAIRLTPEQIKANGIQTAAATEQEIVSTITAIGRVTARAGGEAQVFSPFAGRLVADPARLPRIGSFVKQGAVIAEVEQMLTAAEQAQLRAAAAQFGGTAAQLSATAAQLQATIEQARHEVAFQQIEVERAKRLYDGGAISLKQLQTAEFKLRQSQASLDGARRAKEQYEAARAQSEAAQQQQTSTPPRVPLRAPISGMVVAAELTAGQQIDPAKSLLTIVDLSRVWIEVAVHESQLRAVRRAARVTFTTPADPDRAYTGQLVTINGVIDPANRNATVIFAAGNPNGALKIGMTAEARIPGGARIQALLIPASAALTEESQSIVFVEVQPGVYQRSRVTLGERNGDSVVISSGLKAGEKVVSVGAASLRSETLKGQIESEDDEKEEKR
ncbi:MAG: efflux RND transporter periplasmic adaptor subunit [Blastocatellales bacterium]